MNLYSIKNIAFINPGASPQALDELERKVGVDMPIGLGELLLKANGLGLENGILIYASNEILERNETYQVEKYMPGFISIGDDSGGRAIMLSRTLPEVFLVGYGCLDTDEMKTIANSLSEWIDSGCPL